MKPAINLADIAERVMIEKGFVSEFPSAVLRELDSINAPAIPRSHPSFRDMRDLLWISIDNDDSLDLDQLTFGEKLNSRVDRIYVAIADVDALIKKGSAIDEQASFNTTSVYTPTKVFPMFPLKLSTDLTSLSENADRCAIVVEMQVNDEGQYNLAAIYPAWVRNRAKLTYNNVGAWLEKKGPLPGLSEELAEQLELQDKIAQRIQAYRTLQGALHFGKTEVEPIIRDGMVVGLQEVVRNRAHSLIENIMIIANIGMTDFFAEQQIPILKRIVRIPERWDRIVGIARVLGESLPLQPNIKALRDFLQKRQHVDPLRFNDLSLAIIKLLGKGEYVLEVPGGFSIGHFDLGLRDYAHTTAPNRRYPDVIVQRLLKSYLYADRIAYSPQELQSLAMHCTQKEDDAAKVERRMQKSAAAMILSTRVGQQFQAMITGSGEKGTWVRLSELPIEGRLVNGIQGLDVGDYLTVKLTHVDIAKGYIDFMNLSK